MSAASARVMAPTTGSAESWAAYNVRSSPPMMIRLVMVNGVARLGMLRSWARLGAQGSGSFIGGELRTLYAAQDSADPVVGAITRADAADILGEVLGRLGQPGLAAAAPEFAAFNADGPAGSLALDELAPTGAEIRFRLPSAGQETGPVLGLPPPPLAPGPSGPRPIDRR